VGSVSNSIITDFLLILAVKRFDNCQHLMRTKKCAKFLGHPVHRLQCQDEVSAAHQHYGRESRKVLSVTSTCPLPAASCSGELSSRPEALQSAPARSSSRATLTRPWLLASCRGVHPNDKTTTSRPCSVSTLRKTQLNLPVHPLYVIFLCFSCRSFVIVCLLS